jgi:hypothetical protein
VQAADPTQKPLIPRPPAPTRPPGDRRRVRPSSGQDTAGRVAPDRQTPRPHRLLALEPPRRHHRRGARPARAPALADRTSTTASSKTSSASTIARDAPTSAGSTTSRSSPPPTPTSPRSVGRARVPSGPSNTPADSAAAPAAPQVLDRPLPNLPTTDRDPQPSALPTPTGVTKQYRAPWQKHRRRLQDLVHAAQFEFSWCNRLISSRSSLVVRSGRSPASASA